MTAIADKYVIIRAPHQCWGCADVHQPGTRMNRVTWVESGQISSSYWCDTCERYWQDGYYDVGEGIDFGSLLQEDPESWLETDKEVHGGGSKHSNPHRECQSSQMGG